MVSIRKDKKMRKNLINKKALSYIIKNSNICQHAIKELNLAGYNNGCKNSPNTWMYNQVMEAIAVFSNHGNSGYSAPFEINLVQKLCSWDIISPLTFKDDEWNLIYADGDYPNLIMHYQNKRKSSIFKDEDIIYDIDAFVKVPNKTYRFNTKQWEENTKEFYWNGGLFEHKNNILTGRYFSKCNIRHFDAQTGFTPNPTRKIPCVEVEISPDNWIMAVDTNDIQLLLLSCDYDIEWKECTCMKDVRLEDVTSALYDLAIEQIKNNK